EAYRVLKPGGVFLFNVWDAIEQNDFPHIAHTVISEFFDNDPTNFYEIPFSFHDPETIAALLTGAGFQNITTSLVATTTTAPSVRDLTQGLVQGNPVITAIRE